MAFHRHVLRHLPAAGVRARSDADPARNPRPGGWAWSDHAAVLFPRARPGLSERDRALLTLLRPHLHQAYLDAERRRRPIPQLTPRQKDLLHLVAAGHTNTQIARRLGLSEGTVRTHLENIYERLQVSSRTAAVTRAFPNRSYQSSLRSNLQQRRPFEP